MLIVDDALQSHLLLYWHGSYDVSVTLSNQTLDVHPRSDSTELPEAVPIIIDIHVYTNK